MDVEAVFTFPRLFFVFFLCFFRSCDAFIEDIYCGDRNCYDVLGVTQDADKADISKAYRQLARKYHPDMHRSKEAKEEAEIRFRELATAYETLRDDESRKDYDYMLDHPDEFYQNYYRYYRRRLAPKVDIRIVLVVSISIISLVQYLVGVQRYQTAIDNLALTERFRNQAILIAEKERLFPSESASKGKNKKSKLEVKKEKEVIIKKIIEEKINIKGGYAKPTLRDVLWLQIFFFPWRCGEYLLWNLRWIWKFTIKKEEYGREEKLYIIRKNMGLSETQFMALEDTKHDEFLAGKLWIRDIFQAWKQEQEDEQKARLAQDPRYKRYRRYMKNHGPGQITFED